MNGFNQPCGICGQPATTADGVVGAYLCDSTECLEAAWDLAFGDASDSEDVPR